MTMPRILQICTGFPPGGIQRHVLDVSRWLRTRDWHVAIAGSPGAWLDQSMDPHFFPLGLNEVAEAGGALPRRMFAAHAAATRLRVYLKREGFDLIHAHESAPALVAKLASVGLKIPVALTFHGAEPERIPQFAMIAKRCADHILTPSRMSADELSKAGGMSRDAIRVIGLGVHAPTPLGADETAALRRRLLDDGDTLVVTVARLAHQKAIDHLVAVAKKLQPAHPGLRFVVVGGGPQFAEAQEWIRNAGLNEVVTLAGRSDTPGHYLSAADIFFLPSRWESLPITIVEAFRAGLPVVATDTGGVRELVDDAVGAVAPVGDIDAMADALSRIVARRDHRANLADAALRRGRESRFDPDVVNEKMAAAYLEMIAAQDFGRTANA